MIFTISKNPITDFYPLLSEFFFLTLQKLKRTIEHLSVIPQIIYNIIWSLNINEIGSIGYSHIKYNDFLLNHFIILLPFTYILNSKIIYYENFFIFYKHCSVIFKVFRLHYYNYLYHKLFYLGTPFKSAPVK